MKTTDIEVGSLLSVVATKFLCEDEPQKESSQSLNKIQQ